MHLSITKLFNKLSTQNSVSTEYIVAEMPAHIYCKNKNGVLIWSNNDQAKTFGYMNVKDLIGITNFDLNIGDDLARILTENDMRIMQSGKQEVIEEKAITNGKERIFLSQKKPLQNNDGEIVGILGVSIEITERKNAELELINAKKMAETDNKGKTDFLEQLLLEMPAHVYWKDRNCVYLGCNDTQAQTFNFTSGKEVVGKTDFDLLHGTISGDILAELSRKNDLRVMNSGIKETIEEKAIVNGQEKIYLSQKTPLRNKEKDIIGILGVSIDITERKMMEQELVKAKEEAEIANNSKTEFLQNMRHDFRTPFCGILGMANILYENEIDNDKKEKLSNIVKSSQVLLEQLNEITDFISLENGNLAMVEKQFNIYKIVTDIENLHLPAAQAKQLKFIIEMDSQVSKYVIGDMVRTQRILMNLLANAIKFTKVGHVALNINLAREENNNIVIKFKIDDTGIGVPKEEQDGIFEKFSRLNPSYRGTYPGKGLGLKIVKQFLDELGGEIHVKSETHRGSTFVVLIPYKLPLLRCDEEDLLTNVK